MDQMMEMDPSGGFGAQDDNPDDEQLVDAPGDPDNLVPDIEKTDEGKAWLKKTAQAAIRLVKGDLDARKDWMDRREEQTKLFAGVVDPMKYPAEGGRAPHDPIICRTVLQMWTRGCDQIVPVKGSLIQVTPVGPEDEDLASKRETHMNWQLRHKVPNYVPGHRESFLQFLMSGSVFREHSWDPVLQTSRFDYLTADDVVVPYSRKDIDPLMRRVPRVTRILRWYRWELEDLEEAGHFPAGMVTRLYSREQGGGAPVASDDSRLEEQAQEIDGVKKPITVSAMDDVDSQQREVFRCHMWLKLPKEKRQRAVTLEADVTTGIALSLKIREDEDPFDRTRFDQQMKAFTITSQNVKTQYAAGMQQWQMAAQQAQMTGQPPPPQPAPPQMPKQPDPVKMRPIWQMIHYRLFPNPHGFYGLGVAYLLTNTNELVNSLEAEYLLAARFANMKQGFLSKGAIASGRGELRLTMGKFTQTELESEQMNGIKEFSFSPPSESLHSFIQQMKQDAYTLVADVDTLTGQAGPTNETKAAAMQRQTNATALMTAVAALYLETMALEPKMLARDNSLFLPDQGELYWVTTPDKTKPQLPGVPPTESRQPATATREEYASEFDFTFTADQRLATQPERVQTAMNIIDRLMNSPYAKDPNVGPVLFYAAFSKLFRALELPDMEKAMGTPPQPPAPPPPPQPMAQEDENKMFFNDQDHPVLPDDQDEDHLMKLDDLEQSPYYAQLSSTGKQIFARHKRAHVGQLYRKEMALRQQGDQHGFAGHPTGGNGGLPAGPGQSGAAGPPPGAAVGRPQAAPGAVPPVQ